MVVFIIGIELVVFILKVIIIFRVFIIIVIVVRVDIILILIVVVGLVVIVYFGMMRFNNYKIKKILIRLVIVKKKYIL